MSDAPHPMDRTEDGLSLPATTQEGQARAAALAAASLVSGGTGRVDYSSSGRVLVIGPGERVVSVLRGLAPDLTALGIASDGGMGEGESGGNLLIGSLTGLDGHLGNFRAAMDRGRGEENPAHWLDGQPEAFDLVVDLSEDPLFSVSVPPPGYYRPGGDAEALGQVLRELPEMVGEFEKPRYFNYEPDICAHGNRGQSACSLCLDTCPTGAIASVGERVEVDPYLCQGCGICASACPTGAMTYAYPPVTELLEGTRRAFRTFREHGSSAPIALFHDDDRGADLVDAVAQRLPERALPLQVEEVTSLGMDAWLTSLAYGAAEVVVLLPDSEEIPATWELRNQIGYAREILAGLGLDRERLCLVEASHPEGVTAAFASPFGDPPVPPAGFAALGGKRDLIRQSLDYLYAQAPEPAEVMALPKGAPYGEVRVDGDACTLCMACVSICPAGALLDGDERPQVRFLEANCVQCGLCESACPEDAVTLTPRAALDPTLAKEERLLHEEEPFHCLGCGKAFATRSMVERMTEKLAEHWMYQDSASMHRRLQMCGDCRAKDMFAQEGGFDVHNKP